MTDDKAPSNPRRRQRREEQRLLVLIAVILVVAGGAAVALVYGRRAVALSLACLISGAALLGFLWGILVVIGRWSE